jgi:ribonuclease P protein component
VLPAAHRLTDTHAFRHASRTGRRAASRTLVAHLAQGEDEGLARAGFVVSRAVGSAVLRNRVKRRLRHLVREQISSLPDASLLVVRALPPAADASATELREDLARCLDRVRP